MKTTNSNLILIDLLPLAKRAYQHISFDPEKRGDRIIKDYSKELEADILIVSDREKYITHYKKRLSAWLAALSNCASTMITGSSNFNIQRAEKKNRSESKRYYEFRQWRERTLKSIERAKIADRTPEEKHQEKFILIERSIQSSLGTIRDIDNGLNKTSARELFVNSIIARIKRIAKNGDFLSTKKALDILSDYNLNNKIPVITPKHSIWKILEVINKEKENLGLEASKNDQEIPFNGGRILLNYGDERVQIKHDQKPSPDVIASLKSKAFRWSPTNKAWQRQITNAAIIEAKRLCGIN